MKSMLIAITALMTFTSQLTAAPILIQYQATVETVTGSFLGYTVPRGTIVTGNFLFDTSVSDSFTNINRGHYEHSGNGGFTANFQALNSGIPVAVTISGSGSPEVRVEWFETLTDTWRFWDGTSNNTVMFANGVPKSDLNLIYSMSQPIFFASDANTNPWPLAQFGGIINNTSHTFPLSDSNGSILMQINSFSVIPEPTFWASVLSVLFCCYCARRYSIRHG